MTVSRLDETDRFLGRYIWFITALLTLRVIVWGFEQRAHDKEYWLILAHVIPFLLVLFTGALILLLLKKLVFGRLVPKTDRHEAPR